MQLCSVCGEWYAGVGIGRYEVCVPCFQLNFAGNALEGPTARDALEAYVHSQDPLSARQQQAMRHLQARWALEGTGGEDLR